MTDRSRRDIAVYNEATGFLVTSRQLAGRKLTEGDRAWTRKVARGELLPFELAQDDPFVIRVVLSEPLLPQEKHEWIGRIAHSLVVPDGKLVIAAGSEFVGDAPGDEPEESEETRILEIPAGRYTAVLCAYLPSQNASYLLEHSGTARDVSRWERPAPEPEPITTVDVLSRVRSYSPVRVEGDAVELPVRHLDRAYLIAWFATDAAEPEIRIQTPQGVQVELSRPAMADAVAGRVGGGWRIGIASTASRRHTTTALREMASHLASLPDGSHLELMTSPPSPAGNKPRGLTRFLGMVRAGVWAVAEAFPGGDAKRLCEALTLSERCESESELDLGSVEEAAAPVRHAIPGETGRHGRTPGEVGEHDHPDARPLCVRETFPGRVGGLAPCSEHGCADQPRSLSRGLVGPGPASVLGGLQGAASDPPQPCTGRLHLLGIRPHPARTVCPGAPVERTTYPRRTRHYALSGCFRVGGESPQPRRNPGLDFPYRRESCDRSQLLSRSADPVGLTAQQRIRDDADPHTRIASPGHCCRRPGERDHGDVLIA